MKFDSRLNRLEKSIPYRERWAVLFNHYNAAGELTFSNGTINPTLTIDLRGVEASPEQREWSNKLILNHKPVSCSGIEKAD